MICSDGVDCCDVLDSKVEHVESQIPSGSDIMGHLFFWEPQDCEELKTNVEEDGLSSS